jgi:hypothetical protein
MRALSLVLLLSVCRITVTHNPSCLLADLQHERLLSELLEQSEVGFLAREMMSISPLVQRSAIGKQCWCACVVFPHLASMPRQCFSNIVAMLPE